MKRIIISITAIFLASFSVFGDEYISNHRTDYGFAIYNCRTQKYIGNYYNNVRNLGIYGGRHYFAFQKGTVWGIWSVKDDYVINSVPAKYDEIFSDFSHGFFIFRWQGSNGISNVYDEVAITPIYRNFTYTSNGVVAETWSGEHSRFTWDDLANNAKLYKEQRENEARQRALAAEAKRREQHIELCRSSFMEFKKDAEKQLAGILKAWLAKGEFEPSSEYFKRTCGPAMVDKLESYYSQIRNKFIAVHDSLIRHESICGFKLGQYSADEESFEISSKYLGSVPMRVSADKAKIFKERFSKMQVGDMTLDIINDKIACKSVSFVDSENGMSYSYQSSQSTIRERRYFRNYSDYDIKSRNIKTGKPVMPSLTINISEPSEEMLLRLLRRGSVTIHGTVKYADLNKKPTLHYLIWVDGKEMPIQVSVLKHTKYESFSFDISRSLGNKYIIVAEDSEGTVSAPIVIDVNGMEGGQ